MDKENQTLEIQEYLDQKYKKVFDNDRDPIEACQNSCCFCMKDDTGEFCCGAPDTSDFRFFGCAREHFHWEKI